MKKPIVGAILFTVILIADVYGCVPAFVPPFEYGSLTYSFLFPKENTDALKYFDASAFIVPTTANRIILAEKKIRDIVQHYDRKPELVVDLPDVLPLDRFGRKIGFSGTCRYADSVFVNGERFRVNPVTMRFYATVSLKRFEENTLTCTAENNEGRVIVDKKIIYRQSY